MKFLLTAINAKYIHSNPAVYSLAAYAGKVCPEAYQAVEIAEYTINQTVADILSDLYNRKPDVIGFSCYIWNIEYVGRLVTELKKLLPKSDIWLGGPEVSYDAITVLEKHPQLSGIMVGEGEAAFTELLEYYFRKKQDKSGCLKGKSLKDIAGLVFREEPGGKIRTSEQRGLTDLSGIPFLYDDLEKFENRIIYYESSRGCPFQCSYCLSSIEKQVRFRDIEIVKQELQFFLDHRVKQVKFVDRTFNCSHTHAMEIWRYIKEHDNGITNFHFEIAADILNEEELTLINTLRPGAVQMEIGVQSVNLKTIQAIERKMDLNILRRVVERLHQGNNVHIHLDLIAGLPYEDFMSFQNSFNEVFAMEPEQLQLGFLKVLKGSKMHQKVSEYGIAYIDTPPYEVLYTKWISYEEILKLKQVEEMVELYYNSGQFQHTLPFLLQQFETAYQLFEALADFYNENGYFIRTPSRMYRYQILIIFTEKFFAEKADLIRQMLVIDYYQRENAKARPEFAGETEEEKADVRSFWKRESKEHRWLTGEKYASASAKELSGMAHIEPVHYDLRTGERLTETEYLLFDYENRDPLTYAADIKKLIL